MLATFRQLLSEHMQANAKQLQIFIPNQDPRSQNPISERSEGNEGLLALSKSGCPLTSTINRSSWADKMTNLT